MARMGKIIHEELSGAIIGIAMEVLNELNPGLDEKLYERAMIIEMRRKGHVVAVQPSFPVFYRGELIGNMIPDLINRQLRYRGPESCRGVQRNACRTNDRILE